MNADIKQLEQEGCQLIIPDTATAERACTLTGGRIYLDGAVRVIPETHFNLHGIGVETVGVKLKTEVITEVDDPDLDDPAAGFANYRQSGAHRLKETIEVVINDEHLHGSGRSAGHQRSQRE